MNVCLICKTLKVIVHVKIKIVSSFTHTNGVSNLCEFLSSGEQKEDILKYLVTKKLTIAIDFYSIFFHTIWKSIPLIPLK